VKIIYPKIIKIFPEGIQAGTDTLEKEKLEKRYNRNMGKITGIFGIR